MEDDASKVSKIGSKTLVSNTFSSDSDTDKLEKRKLNESSYQNLRDLVSSGVLNSQNNSPPKSEVNPITTSTVTNSASLPVKDVDQNATKGFAVSEASKPKTVVTEQSKFRNMTIEPLPLALMPERSSSVVSVSSVNSVSNDSKDISLNANRNPNESNRTDTPVTSQSQSPVTAPSPSLITPNLTQPISNVNVESNMSHPSTETSVSPANFQTNFANPSITQQLSATQPPPPIHFHTTQSHKQHFFKHFAFKPHFFKPHFFNRFAFKCFVFKCFAKRLRKIKFSC